MSMNTPFHLRQREFNVFNAANPAVWEYFERFTLEAITHGHRKISHWLIINRIRWEVVMTTTGADFKICNNHIAFYARLFVKVHSATFTGRVYAGHVTPTRRRRQGI